MPPRTVSITSAGVTGKEQCASASDLTNSEGLSVTTPTVEDYDEEYWQELQQLTNDSDYGVTWTYMPDGFGIPRVALLTPPPEQGSNSRLAMPNGGEVKFYLYSA